MLVVAREPAPPDTGHRPLGHHIGDDVDELGAGLVVRQAGLAGLVAGPFRGLRVDAHRDVGQIDRDRLGRQFLPVGHGGLEHVEDLQRTLDLGRLGRVLGGDVQAGHEVAGRHEHRVRLSQRRQHPADVVEERRGGPHHEHTVSLHLLAVGVKQVRHAVQRHHGLAGTRAALDDQHAGVVKTDDLVLLGLDGRDDVAHALTARSVDGREQRGVVGGVVLGTRRRPRISSVKSTTLRPRV